MLESSFHKPVVPKEQFQVLTLSNGSQYYVLTCLCCSPQDQIMETTPLSQMVKCIYSTNIPVCVFKANRTVEISQWIFKVDVVMFLLMFHFIPSAFLKTGFFLNFH